jgi:RecB family endonuclease NucS
VATVLIRRSGGEWEPPGVTSFENEAELQRLVVESPGLVGASASVVALPEFALPNAGSLDVLLIDLDGSITLVEAKLNRNPEIRRAVVGQLLGYAA